MAPAPNILRLAALSLACVPAPAQQLSVPPGYAAEIIHQEASVPYALNGFALHPLTGQLYISVFNEILRLDAQGRPQLLHRLPAGQRSGLFTVLPGRLELFYSVEASQTLYRYDLLRSTRTQTTLPKNCFDLAATSGGTLLCSANPDWPKAGAQTGIYQQLGNGSWRRVIDLRGPSGPLCFDPAGNLLYATQSDIFPNPKGAVDLLLFDASSLQRTLQGGPRLGLQDASTVLRGLDGAYDMLFDPRGRLVLSDPSRGGLRRSLPGSLVLDPKAFVPVGPLSIMGMQLLQQGPGELDPFQPPGAALYVHTSDWTRSAEVQRIRPQRPVLSSRLGSSIPPGPLPLDLSHGPSLGSVLLALSPRPLLSSPQLLLRENGVACWLQLDLSAPFLLLGQNLDAQGQAQLLLRNPGGFSLPLQLQALALGPRAGAGVLGSSAALVLQIRP